MTNANFETSAFDASVSQGLRSKNHLELLDIIDNLRAQGLNEHVDLPQLIVCGDQSSGKSSVLAAISGIPFPKKENLCTRFATEVSLRRNDAVKKTQVTASIVPGSSHANTERSAIDAFKQDLRSLDDLSSVFDKASDVMGLGSMGTAFSSDILRLEARGPHLPQLTIVDLPGLIHSENKYQSAEDIKLVNELVERYMQQDRSIILSVISAKNDYANQIVLSKARQVDPDGKRTLGIITKPDTLFAGSASETSFLSLAKNQDVKFTLGWHVVRNLDTNDKSSEDRNAVEAAFFESSKWSTLSNNHRGVGSLRDRLSVILFEQIKRELPSLIREIAAARQDTSNELSRMGRSRHTKAEQRIFVIELGEKFRELCHAACDGRYDDSFFAEHATVAASPRRLRAVLQNANIQFAKMMTATAPRVSQVDPTDTNEAGTITNLERAKNLIQSHRGKELPGTFNPALIGQLFRELSAFWDAETRGHAESIWIHARSAVVAILSHITEEHVRNACMSVIVDDQLERLREDLMTRLTVYLQDFKQHPISYNDHLTKTVQRIRSNRQNEKLRTNLGDLFSSLRGVIRTDDTEAVVTAALDKIQPVVEDVAAQDLADYAEVYYEVALKRAIDEIPAHVIEGALMTPLSKILEPSKILAMSQDKIELIGGESPERMQHRRSLEAKLKILNRSDLTCKMYAERTTVNIAASFDTTFEQWPDDEMEKAEKIQSASSEELQAEDQELQADDQELQDDDQID